MNLLSYFEIPVNDLDRAVDFYEKVLEIALEKTTVDGYPMALFPAAEGEGGPSGALAQGDVYVPTVNGSILYFSVRSIDDVVSRAVAAGGCELYPKKQVDEGVSVAEIGDTEGNRIALIMTT